MKKLLLTLLSIWFWNFGNSQTSFYETKLNVTRNIEWTEPTQIKDFDESDIVLLHFNSASFNFPYDSIPIEKYIVRLPSGTNWATAEITILESNRFSANDEKALLNKSISARVIPDVAITYYQKQAFAIVSFHPVYIDANSGQHNKVIKYTLNINPSSNGTNRAPALSYKDNSVLRSGTWAKVGVTKDGIYSLSFEDLQSLGLQTSNLSSNSVRLFGNGGGYLPFKNDKPRLDDLEENAIKIIDGGDGNFGPGDQLLFYGQDPHRWKYVNGEFRHSIHFFSDTTYYFVTTDYTEGTAKRINGETSISNPADITVNDFTDFQYHEVDLLNFVKSGRNWYGESYNFTKTRTFTFNFPNIVSSTATINSYAAFRVIGRPGNLEYRVDGNKILNLYHGGVSGGYYDQYAAPIFGTGDFTPSNSTINVTTEFLNPSTSDNAWLDYIEVICQRQLKFTGNQMSFRNEESVNASVIQYNVDGFDNKEVWDVTNPTDAKLVSINNNSIKSYGGQVNEFIAFSSSNYLSPVKFGNVPNQNLHGIQQADYVIITHPKFLGQANQLADYHRTNSNLNTVVVTTQQIYNEYSSGSQDITAMKMFNKMLYDRAGTDPNQMLKYVLLFGDASYDYKYRITDNTNYVPGYQSWNSHAVLGSYITDDYVGFLDDYEGDELNASLDVGIGRIMAKNTSQAQDIVDKTIHYMTNQNCMKQWRNWITFVGDDEDGLVHMSQSDQLATTIDTTYKTLNINKIYLDAYQQVSNAGGSTYPDVNSAIDQTTERGNLIINYIGHGGELGWAHERILGLSQINNYSNIDALALYLTATCEFSRFDDPDRTSAGEFCLLNPNGSALALLTTTRLVYSSPNFELAKKFFSVAFEKVDGEWPRLGDLLKISKIGGNNINYRNFSLLGDPAAVLSYPEYGVETTSLPDTIKSLQKVTLTGYVMDEASNKKTDYNGIIYPTIFGKRRVQQTLNNDNQGVFEFETQTNALFNGKASVNNGEFEFSFIVPKDIDFNYGFGKASFYAEDGQIDATGFDTSFVIGGRDGDPDADQVGPTINLWMNDESFVMGGVTDENPLIYAKIFDESGINTVGSGIGHDIVAVIDENTSNSITLNEYYESDIDSYQKGSVSYALNNLPEGKHTLRLKAWDVYNNSNEAYTEFTVSNSGEFQIKNVLNYPNPFTTNTDFYFEHNALGQNIDVRIQIFTVSGKLVKTIDHSELSESYRIGPINWDGRDQFGDRIGKGTYIYKVKATNGSGNTVEKFEKIVIL